MIRISPEVFIVNAGSNGAYANKKSAPFPARPLPNSIKTYFAGYTGSVT